MVLGIIGGTGLYKIEGMDVINEHHISTPFGDPSAPIIEGQIAGNKVMFLPRHGLHHQFLPGEVNYRANIFALKSLGVRSVVSFSAVGSLQENIVPGDLVLSSQYIDFTKGDRNYTFFGDGLVAHVSTAEPVCSILQRDVLQAGEMQGIVFHQNKTYVCVEGPRLGTKAESMMFRQLGCDIVGMTNIPEIFLAKEAQISLAAVAIVTDYDCWLEDPSMVVTVEKVMQTYFANIDTIKQLVHALAVSALTKVEESERLHLRQAIMTKEDCWTERHKEILDVLLR